jgi:hypothetical protein
MSKSNNLKSLNACFGEFMCPCCDKNFNISDMKIHLSEKIPEDVCPWCREFNGKNYSYDEYMGHLVTCLKKFTKENRSGPYIDEFRRLKRMVESKDKEIDLIRRKYSKLTTERQKIDKRVKELKKIIDNEIFVKLNEYDV